MISVLAVIILVIVIAVSATSKVSLKKYVAEELEYSGLNGYGFVENADNLINWAALQSDISDYKYDEYAYGSYAPIAGYITYEITSENNGTLSNGDKVVFTVKIAQDMLEENPVYKKGISGGEEQKFEFTVSGLEEGVTIDVFDAVEGVVIDSTLNNAMTIKVKDNYVRDYGKDGINVKTEDGKIRVYGDNFRSFEISVHSMNYKASAKIERNVNADAGVKYTVKYSSSNPSVATVDSNGNVKATGTGNATITCTVTDEYGNIVSDTCNVKVSYAWWQWIIVIVLFGWIWY